jgi:hypothetical protein
VNFARLQRADAVAMLAALALLFVMAVDWYTTAAGEEARRVEEFTQPEGAEGGELERRVDEEAGIIAEGEERNAWQQDGAIDRLILLGLLLSVAFALGAGFLRAAGRRFEPPFTPSSLGALAAAFAALLVTYRIWQEPGFDEFTTVKPGAPLAILVLGVLALALATAYRGEESGRAWERMTKVDAQAAKPEEAPGT